MLQQNTQCQENSYTLCFKLKQHTPLIHFQAEQKGATLRATELKPKLDRFLIKKFKNSIDNKYKISKDKDALDYKVSIVDDIEKDFRKDPKGAYFGKNKNFKSQNIHIKIISMNTNLIQEIDNYFEEFINTTSFGTRQNKGFGLFSLDSTTNTKFEQDIGKHYFFKCIKNDSNNPIENIKDFYQELKSGIGNPKSGTEDPDGECIYKNSKLMIYFQPKILWEKQWIKKKIYEQDEKIFNDLKDKHHNKDNINFPDDENKYRYIRALLGLGYRYEFITNKYENNDKNKDYKLIVVTRPKEKNLKRFKSPITFFVFEKKIYIAIKKENPINEVIFDKEFTFTAYYQEDKNDRSKHIELGSLSTPKKEEFNLNDFFNTIKGVS